MEGLNYLEKQLAMHLQSLTPKQMEVIQPLLKLKDKAVSNIGKKDISVNEALSFMDESTKEIRAIEQQLNASK